MSGDTRKFVVAVVGDGELPEDDPRRALAFDLGRRIVDAGFRLICGGLGGVMEEACRGAASSPEHTGGEVIGILPGLDPAAANPWVDIAIPTGLDRARNLIVANADAVVAVGGSSGTLMEIAAAWQLLRPVVALSGGGWSAAVAGRPLDNRLRCAEIADDRVYAAESPAEAVELVKRLVSLYRRRPSAIQGPR